MSSNGSRKDVGVVGAAALPHAPQFFTLPETEDREQVERVRASMLRIGKGLRALEPDIVIVVSNDHLENFFLRCVPAFTVHCGAQMQGSFAGRDFRWPGKPDIATGLVEYLQDESFDPAFTLDATISYAFGIPLTFCGFDAETAILPIFVNSYVAPQPRTERCYAFGRALHRALASQGTRAVVIASGGLSHYPGTTQYEHPDVDTDDELLAKLRTGNLRALLAFDDEAMDRTGNVETRSWQILAGALGERRPDEVGHEPSWHHTYTTLGWTEPSKQRHPTKRHYPGFVPERVALASALYGLRMDAQACSAYVDDRRAYAGKFGLDSEEEAALLALDVAALRDVLGMHPLLVSGALRQVGAENGRREADPSTPTAGA